MKVEGVTTSRVLASVYENGNLAAKVKVARTIDDKKVQEEILENGNPRELMALASNPNIDEDIQLKLAELGKRYPGILATLAERNADYGD